MNQKQSLIRVRSLCAINKMVDCAEPEILIDSIQARPCLWDVFSLDYNDRFKSRTAWNDVAKTFYPEFDTFSDQEKNTIVLAVQRKWRNMRDSYVKDLRLWTGKSPNALRAGKRRKYIFYDKLSFLKGSVEAKMSRLQLPVKRDRSVAVSAGDSGDSLSDEDSFLTGSTATEMDRIDPKALISVVEATPCIWDISCQDYRDRLKTKESWLNICRVFYPQYDDLQESDRINILGTVQRMWRNFRDSFVKDWKSSQNTSMRSLRRKKYVFYDQLQFLLKSLEWKSRTNPAGSLNEENSDELSYPEYDSWYDGGGGGLFADEDTTEIPETKYNPHLHQQQLQQERGRSGGGDAERTGGEEEAEGREEEDGEDDGNTEPLPPPSIYPICSISNSPQPEDQQGVVNNIHKEMSSATFLSDTVATCKREQPRSLAPTNLPTTTTVQPVPQALELLHDDDIAFFYSLLPSVRALDEDDKLDFRVEVMKLLRKMKTKRKSTD